MNNVFTTLIDCHELAQHVQHPDWIVCDCRHDLLDYHAGRRAYDASHISGARFLHLDEDLSGPKSGVNGRHPLPHAHTFALRMGALGIDESKQIVAYDASGGCYAARLWWMLRWIGHARVAVLDGGWDAWLAQGLPTTTAGPSVGPTVYRLRSRAALSVDSAFVAQHIAANTITLIDARSAERFRGENETLDPVAGHIPGALNRFFKLNLDSTGRFKTPEELKKEWNTLLGSRHCSTAVHQCGSGVTACHNLLAMEHAGLEGSRLYAGSWSEWISDRSRAVAR